MTLYYHERRSLSGLQPLDLANTDLCHEGKWKNWYSGRLSFSVCPQLDGSEMQYFINIFWQEMVRLATSPAPFSPNLSLSVLSNLFSTQSRPCLWVSLPIQSQFLPSSSSPDSLLQLRPFPYYQPYFCLLCFWIRRTSPLLLDTHSGWCYWMNRGHRLLSIRSCAQVNPPKVQLPEESFRAPNHGLFCRSACMDMHCIIISGKEEGGSNILCYDGWFKSLSC